MFSFTPSDAPQIKSTLDFFQAVAKLLADPEGTADQIEVLKGHLDVIDVKKKELEAEKHVHELDKKEAEEIIRKRDQELKAREAKVNEQRSLSLALDDRQAALKTLAFEVENKAKQAELRHTEADRRDKDHASRIDAVKAREVELEHLEHKIQQDRAELDRKLAVLRS